MTCLLLLFFTSCSSKKSAFQESVLPIIRQSLLNETVKFQASFVDHELTYAEYEKYYINACYVYNGLTEVSNGKPVTIDDKECVELMLEHDPAIANTKK